MGGTGFRANRKKKGGGGGTRVPRVRRDHKKNLLRIKWGGKGTIAWAERATVGEDGPSENEAVITPPGGKERRPLEMGVSKHRRKLRRHPGAGPGKNVVLPIKKVGGKKKGNGGRWERPNKKCNESGEDREERTRKGFGLFRGKGGNRDMKGCGGGKGKNGEKNSWEIEKTTLMERKREQNPQGGNQGLKRTTGEGRKRERGGRSGSKKKRSRVESFWRGGGLGLAIVSTGKGERGGGGWGPEG